MSVLLFFLMDVFRAEACAIAPRLGDQVQALQEDVIVTWDGTTQHLIRQAYFKEEGHDFGFIVPTPSLPTLAERKASTNPMSVLHEQTRAKEIFESYTAYNFTPVLRMFFARPQGVTSTYNSHDRIEIYTQKVAGMKATVLQPDSPEALWQWMEENEYPASPSLQKWAQHYIEKGWYLTAFQMSNDNRDARDDYSHLKSSLVDISFETDKPFFPYREPAPIMMESHLEPPPTLRRTRRFNLYFISSFQPKTTLGEEGDMWMSPYFSAEYPLDGFEETGLEDILPEKAWVTRYDDRLVERPQKDLYFAPAARQDEIQPPPIYRQKKEEVIIPVDIATVAAVVVGVLIWNQGQSSE